MYLSNSDWGRLDQIFRYFDETLQLQDYNLEAYTDFMQILERIERESTADDGYCNLCTGQRLEWAWEIDSRNEYTGGGFYFCPKCGMVYRPRPGPGLSNTGSWVATRLKASAQKFDNEHHVLGRSADIEKEREAEKQ